MKTKPINEELNAAVEWAEKRLNDEFINRCVERYKQEQAQQKQRDIETPGTDAKQSPVTPKDTGVRS